MSTKTSVQQESKNRPVCRTLLVDDHVVVLQGIRSALQDEPDLVILGQATSGKEVLERIDDLNPDLVIMDISMGDMNGIEVTRLIRKRYPDIKIIIFTMYANREYVIDLCKAGISGYVLKESPLSTLIAAIRAVRQGGTYFDAKAHVLIAEQLKESHHNRISLSGLQVLSLREREVFVLLAEGHPIREISETLHISPKTVETHKYNILEKLNARNVIGLTRIAIREGLIEA